MLPKPLQLPETFLCRVIWILLGFSWVSLFSRMSLWWNDASYYTHGWGVPLLTLVLLAKRLPENLAENGKAKSPVSQFFFYPPFSIYVFALWVNPTRFGGFRFGEK